MSNSNNNTPSSSSSGGDRRKKMSDIKYKQHVICKPLWQELWDGLVRHKAEYGAWCLSFLPAKQQQAAGSKSPDGSNAPFFLGGYPAPSAPPLNSPTGLHRARPLAQWVNLQRKQDLLDWQLVHLEALFRGEVGPPHREWSEYFFNTGKSNNNRQWHYMFAKLKFFKAIHGHCGVPIRWKHDPTLGKWVSRQRDGHNKINDERRQLLTEIGFDWRLKIKGQQNKAAMVVEHEKWLANYQYLKEFYKIYGHVNDVEEEIEKNHSSSNNNNNSNDIAELPDPLSFKTWCGKQRTQYHSGRLRSDRITLLNEVHFDWNKGMGMYLPFHYHQNLNATTGTTTTDDQQPNGATAILQQLQLQQQQRQTNKYAQSPTPIMPAGMIPILPFYTSSSSSTATTKATPTGTAASATAPLSPSINHQNFQPLLLSATASEASRRNAQAAAIALQQSMMSMKHNNNNNINNNNQINGNNITDTSTTTTTTTNNNSGNPIIMAYSNSNNTNTNNNGNSMNVVVGTGASIIQPTSPVKTTMLNFTTPSNSNSSRATPPLVSVSPIPPPGTRCPLSTTTTTTNNTTTTATPTPAACTYVQRDNLNTVTIYRSNNNGSSNNNNDMMKSFTIAPNSCSRSNGTSNHNQSSAPAGRCDESSSMPAKTLTYKMSSSITRATTTTPFPSIQSPPLTFDSKTGSTLTGAPSSSSKPNHHHHHHCNNNTNTAAVVGTAAAPAKSRDDTIMFRSSPACNTTTRNSPNTIVHTNSSSTKKKKKKNRNDDDEASSSSSSSSRLSSKNTCARRLHTIKYNFEWKKKRRWRLVCS